MLGTYGASLKMPEKPDISTYCTENRRQNSPKIAAKDFGELPCWPSSLPTSTRWYLVFKLLTDVLARKTCVHQLLLGLRLINPPRRLLRDVPRNLISFCQSAESFRFGLVLAAAPSETAFARKVPRLSSHCRQFSSREHELRAGPNCVGPSQPELSRPKRFAEHQPLMGVKGVQAR